MKDDYDPKPIKVYVGNPPDPPDDECRWLDKHGICHDKDFVCPIERVECCCICEVNGRCSMKCENANEM